MNAAKRMTKNLSAGHSGNDAMIFGKARHGANRLILTWMLVAAFSGVLGRSALAGCPCNCGFSLEECGCSGRVSCSTPNEGCAGNGCGCSSFCPEKQSPACGGWSISCSDEGCGGGGCGCGWVCPDYPPCGGEPGCNYNDGNGCGGSGCGGAQGCAKLCPGAAGQCSGKQSCNCGFSKCDDTTCPKHCSRVAPACNRTSKKCSETVCPCGYANCTSEPDLGGQDCGTLYTYCSRAMGSLCCRSWGCCHGCWNNYGNRWGVNCGQANCWSTSEPGHCSHGGCTCKGGGAATCECPKDGDRPCKGYNNACMLCGKSGGPTTCYMGTCSGYHNENAPYP